MRPAAHYGKRFGPTRRLVVASLAFAACLALVHAQDATTRPRRIAVFGSSVANGTGDELGIEGYTGRLRELLAPRGWEVLNQSRGGDNTVTMAQRFAPVGAPQANVKYLLPVKPSYVLLALSLGNEGIRDGATRGDKEAVFEQFAAGMRSFVDRSRQNGIVPIIALCYTRNDFTAVEYEYVRRMNLRLSGWDVPTINFLGAVDDGAGRWARGFWFDALHPNAAGHVEITRTIVPSLFDALERGKPMAARVRTENYARLTPGDLRITFAPTDTVHPFAFGFTARAQQNGAVASVAGTKLNITFETKKIERGSRTVEFESATLAPAGNFVTGVVIVEGRWAYRSADGRLIRSSVLADDEWHTLLLSHYTARGETLFFVDGRLAGTVDERLEPARVTLGGTATLDARELVFYRSALNADEAAALNDGTLLPASLELYSPLDNVTWAPGSVVENRAQSLTHAVVTLGDGVPASITRQR
jgi:lysophospholipase L1-like esterase